MKRKWLAVGIILLFVATALSPLANANSNTSVLSSKIASKVTNVRIIVYEYRADGSIKRVPIVMSRVDFNTMRSELKGVKVLEEQLSIYKKHGLIPENTTAEQLRLGMIEKAKKIGFSASQENASWPQSLKKKNSSPNPSKSPEIHDTNSSVDCDLIFTFKLHGGLSIITSYLNMLIFGFTPFNFYLPNADVFDVFFSDMGIVRTSHYNISAAIGVFISMIGFVGYMLDISPLIVLTFPFNLLAMFPFPFFSVLSLISGYAAFINILYTPMYLTNAGSQL
jgi:hypothetical protein